MNADQRPKRLLHLVSGLLTGGAEWMLYRLLSVLPKHGFKSEVLSLSDSEPMGAMIRELGVPVRELGFSRSRPNPFGIAPLLREVRRSNPHVIQTWMYHADLAGGVAAKMAGRIPVAWGLHHTTLSGTTKPTTRRVVRLCAHLSSVLPQRIVCCSEATRTAHARMGYDQTRLVVIRNGFDVTTFKPDPSARGSVRTELGLASTTPLVGMVARYHPLKDHANMLRAAAIVGSTNPDVHFVLCGRGVTWDSKPLAEEVRAAGLESRVHLLGGRSDVARLLASLDVAASPSKSEAMPLAIGEAMASGVPCVATDTGDSAVVLGDTGFLVPTCDPEALASSLSRLLSEEQEERTNRGKAARARIRRFFSLEGAAASYAAVYHELGGNRKR
jgi:glycosyltransferase involved in cell wall biosynthesis